MINLTSWVMAMLILLLVLMQTLRVPQTNYLPHPQSPSSFPSVHCLLKHRQKLSHPPQVLPNSTAEIEENLEKALGNSLNIHL